MNLKRFLNYRSYSQLKPNEVSAARWTAMNNQADFKDYILDKWEQIKNGEQVVVNNQWHDDAVVYWNNHPGPEADLFFRDLHIKNWIASLKE
jgi:hypothetical protein